jgi:hypothetical protein
MQRALILVLAGFLGLTLSDVTVLAKGSSGGHSGPSGHSSPTKSKSNLKKKNKKKKKKKKSSAKKHKSKANSKVAKGNKKSKKKKSKKHKDSKVAKNKKSKKHNKHKDSKVAKNKKPKKNRKPKDFVKGNKKGKGKKWKRRVDKFVKRNPRFKKFPEDHQDRIRKVYVHGGRKGLKIDRMQDAKLKKIAKNPNVSRDARNGINNARIGNPMTPAQVDAVQKLAGGSAGGGSAGSASLTEEARRAGLTQEDRDAIRHALEVDADRQSAWKTRFLVVENFTKYPLTVWIHYRTPNAEKKTDGNQMSIWTWLPTRPVREDEALKLTVKPGKVVQVKDGEVPVDANRVRIWARSPGGILLEKDKQKDYWLVPEPRHEYFADDREEHTYTFDKRTIRRTAAQNEAD